MSIATGVETPPAVPETPLAHVEIGVNGHQVTISAPLPLPKVISAALRVWRATVPAPEATVPAPEATGQIGFGTGTSTGTGTFISERLPVEPAPFDIDVPGRLAPEEGSPDDPDVD